MHYFFGFSYWKHPFIPPFFPDISQKDICFVNPFFKKNYFSLAKKKGLNKTSTLYIWGKKSFPLVEAFAQEHNLPLYRIEDGFIRSVGLGSDLTQPYSLVIDSRGIYFDPNQPSDLEYILQHTTFEHSLIQRAQKIATYLKEQKLSKYNLFANKRLHIANTKRVAFVPGQVEDDASIACGAPQMTNLKLLQAARKNAPDAYIIYKPHPDVLVGNRVGNIAEDEALKYADMVVTDIGLESVLEVCDEVHTLTSLVGFEALLRDKKVYTYGMPFYAGWGLTHDTHTITRRTRKITKEELIAATLLLYPKYLHPFTHKLCEIEELLEALQQEKALYENSPWYKRKKQIRNFFSRKSQTLLRILTLKGVV